MALTVDISLLSSDLQQLEAEYERSKLKVRQGTFLCQKSLLEVELLCVREELRNERQSNAKLEARMTQLVLHTESLKEDATGAQQLLESAERALAKEKHSRKAKEENLHRQFEKKLTSQLEKERRAGAAAQATALTEARPVNCCQEKATQVELEPEPSPRSGRSEAWPSERRGKRTSESRAQDEQGGSLPSKGRKRKGDRRRARPQKAQSRQSHRVPNEQQSRFGSDEGSDNTDGKRAQDQRRTEKENTSTQTFGTLPQDGGRLSTEESRVQSQEDVAMATSDRTSQVEALGEDMPGNGNDCTKEHTTMCRENRTQTGRSSSEMDQDPTASGSLTTEVREGGVKEGLTQEEKPEEPVCGERNEAGDRVDNEVRGDPAEGRELTIHQEEASKDQRGSEVGMSDRMGENEGANGIELLQQGAEESGGRAKSQGSAAMAEDGGQGCNGERDDSLGEDGEAAAKNARRPRLRVVKEPNEQDGRGAAKQVGTERCVGGTSHKAARKSQRQINQRSVQEKETEQLKKRPSTNTRKRQAKDTSWNFRKTRSQRQQRVPKGRDDMEPAGSPGQLTNPSAGPETGKLSDKAKLPSCGEGRITSPTEKSRGTSSPRTRSREFSPQAEHRSSSSHHSLPDSATRAGQASGSEPVEATCSSVKRPARENCRKRNVLTVGKRGKENEPKKRKTTCQVDVPPEASAPNRPSLANATFKKKGLFNSRDNSLMISAHAKESSVNTTFLNHTRSVSGMPLRLNEFMKSFIAPKLKSKPRQ